MCQGEDPYYKACGDKSSGRGWPRECYIIERVMDRFWSLEKKAQAHMIAWALFNKKHFKKCYPKVLCECNCHEL